MSSRVRSLVGEAHYFEETINNAEIRRLLDNAIGVKGVPKAIEGMKWLLAQMSKGRDVSQFFASVVKIVSTKSVELKKMVYMFLVHYVNANKKCRELALLAINSYQKDLADRNQLVRALALRVLTSFRVPEILQIQLMAVRKCAADRSPYVRKIAAHAVPKLYAMNSRLKDQLVEIISRLLDDKETMVIGSAVAAFVEVCPGRYDLFHSKFRKLCRLLADIDEWGQIVVMNQLLRYARTQFIEPPNRRKICTDEEGEGDPNAGAADTKKAVESSKTKKRTRKSTERNMKGMSLSDFYKDDEEGNDDDAGDISAHQSDAKLATAPTSRVAPEKGVRESAQKQRSLGAYTMDKDHKLLLRSALPLLKSRNAGVTMAVARLFFYLGSGTPAALYRKIGRCLVRELRSSREVAFVVLCNIAQMAVKWPQMFRPDVQDFFVKSTDPCFIRSTKLRILELLASQRNVDIVLTELQTYCRHRDKSFVVATIRAVAAIAKSVPSVSERCLRGIMTLVKSPSEDIQAASVVVIRQLLRFATSEKTSSVKCLVRLLKCVRVPAARASIVWIVGEYSNAVEELAPDILRTLARSFRNESNEVKVQILNLAAKLWIRNRSAREREDDGDVREKLLRYVVELAKFDVDYDLRDRARLFSGLLLCDDDALRARAAGLFRATESESAAFDGITSTVAGEHAFGKGKVTPVMRGVPNYVVGTLSALVKHSVQGYTDLPPWSTTKSDSSTRDAAPRLSPEITRARGSGGMPSETFYSDDDDDSSSSDSDTSSGDSDDSTKDVSGGDDGAMSDSASASSSSSTSSASESSENEDVSAGSLASTDLLSPSGSHFGSHSIVNEAIAPPNRSPIAHSTSASDDPFSIFDSDDGSSGKMERSENQSQGTTKSRDDPRTATKKKSGALVSNVRDDVADASVDLLGLSMETSMVARSSSIATGEGGDDEEEEDAFAFSAKDFRPCTLVPSRRGRGLEIQVVFTRRASPFDGRMAVLMFHLRNVTEDEVLRDVRIRNRKVPKGMAFRGFQDIGSIQPGASIRVQVHVAFGGQEDAIEFSVQSSRNTFPVTLRAPLGELLEPFVIDDADFARRRKCMTGLREAVCSVTVDAYSGPLEETPKRILRFANVAPTHGSRQSWARSGTCRFAGKRVGHDSPLLFAVKISKESGKGTVRVYCEDAILGTTYLQTLRRAIEGAL
eukprot:g1050.t1